MQDMNSDDRINDLSADQRIAMEGYLRDHGGYAEHMYAGVHCQALGDTKRRAVEDAASILNSIEATTVDSHVSARSDPEGNVGIPERMLAIRKMVVEYRQQYGVDHTKTLDACCQLAHTLSTYGKHEEALTIIIATINVARDGKNCSPDSLSWAHGMAGSIYEEGNDIHSSFYHNTEALRLSLANRKRAVCEEPLSSHSIARACSGIAFIETRQGEYQKAIRWYGYIYDFISREAIGSQANAVLRNNLGCAFYYDKQYDKAYSAFISSVNELLSIPGIHRSPEIAKRALNAAITAKILGRWSDAELHLRLARQYAIRNNQLYIAARVDQIYGMIYVNSGRLHEAKKIFDKIASEDTNPLCCIAAMNNSGAVSADEGNRSVATMIFKKAINLLEVSIITSESEKFASSIKSKLIINLKACQTEGMRTVYIDLTPQLSMR